MWAGEEEEIDSHN